MTIQSVSGNREQVLASIRKAAESQKVDFDYLLQQAKVESGLNPSARAKTSSATGLYQFTAGTWLNVVKRHGDKVGLEKEAQSLRSDNVNAERRAEILALRKEPEVSAHLAARFALDNAQALSSAGHASVGPTELYLAHFLGAGGATSFLNGMRDNPSAPAAKALPAAAAANTSIFYNGTTPRSFRDIYDRFAGKFGASASVVAQAPAANPLKTPSVTEGKIPSEQTIRQIVAKVLASNDAPSPTATANPGFATTAAPVSTDALEKYLKGFSLVDHHRGFTPTDTRTTRDATSGANTQGSSFGEFGQMGLGARLVLEAAAPKNPDQD